MGPGVPGLPSLHHQPSPSTSSQSAGLRPEHFSGLPTVPNYGLAEMQRRLYLTQNENILRAMSNQSAVDPGASGTSRTTVRGPQTALDQAGPETIPGGATTGFSPSGSAFTPVTPKVKKDNSQRYFSPFRLVQLDQPIRARNLFKFHQSYSGK